MRRAALQPVTEIKRHATKIIRNLRKNRVPVLITERGREAAVLVDVESYEAMCQRLKLLEGIARGERAASEGRTVSHARAKQRLARWLSDES